MVLICLHPEPLSTLLGQSQQAAATLNHIAIKARIYHAGLKKMLTHLRTLPSASLDSLAIA